MIYFEVDLRKIEVQILSRMYGLEGAEQIIQEIKDESLRDSLLEGYKRLISS